jgi:23S rRNA pseudouridine2605 synthase
VKPSRNPTGPSDKEGDRLNKFLAACGLGSRRGVEALITEGRVEVNGEPCLALGTRITENDTVRVDGRTLRRARAVTLLLHKPTGYLCTRYDPQGRLTIYDLIPKAFHHLHSIGRLDLDSSGLLLLTTSGELTEQLTHPRHQIEKEYHVLLDRPFDRERIPLLLKGIHLDEGLAQARAAHTLSRKRLSIVLCQGYNRQIRRMFDALNYKVKRLARVRIGQLAAPSLNPGDWQLIGKRDLAKVLG